MTTVAVQNGFDAADQIGRGDTCRHPGSWLRTESARSTADIDIEPSRLHQDNANVPHQRFPAIVGTAAEPDAYREGNRHTGHCLIQSLGIGKPLNPIPHAEGARLDVFDHWADRIYAQPGAAKALDLLGDICTAGVDDQLHEAIHLDLAVRTGYL